MYSQHTIAKAVFILFIHLLHRTSGSEECFANINNFEDGYCHCDDRSSEVTCSIKDFSPNHTFWDQFKSITGFPNTITVNIYQTADVSYFPLRLFLNLPTTVHEVKLKGWSFEAIPVIPVAEISANKSALRTIEISDDEMLTTVFPRAFERINSLQRLIISSNNLSNLTADSFHNLTKLRDLKLNHNKIASLPDKIFKSLTQLVNLTLARNEISTIRRETFTGLSSLQELDLNWNKILFIKNDTFREMKKLRNLDLSHNAIDTIDQAAFRGLGSLETLDLSDNELRYLHKGTLRYNVNLTFVDLKTNHFTIMDIDLLEQLPKTALLKDNHWHCDCSLYIYQENAIASNKDARCEYYDDFNENSKPVEPKAMSFQEYADKIAKDRKSLEKCKELLKTIDKRSHEANTSIHKVHTQTNHNAKFTKSSSNQLMPFMSFIFLMLLLPGLEN